ncbi:DUF1643 domain-containing protein, partial [Piscinibacter sakaiensis]|uniref:DUF1643 domain-containing protein n=1 Tax=Piscinibacter sakaiensis TaxID=1547922 RepID=UPI0006B43F4D
MLTGVKRTARFNACKTYRLALGRHWDDRPKLLVVMFNPSDADAEGDDPTVSLVMQIAAHNGFGGITVMNGIPLIDSKPASAIDMVNTWDIRQDWHQRDWLQRNLSEMICTEAGSTGAVLLAWGALADRCADWFDNVREEIECAVAEGTPIYCLGKTQGGYPKHPLARGKHKVRKDAPLI